MKLAPPILSASNGDSLTIGIINTSFNGGAEVTHFLVRRDSGPATNFEASVEIESYQTTYTFSGLSTAQFYRVQVAAKNSIGLGPFSEYVGFFTTAAPANV